MATLVTTPIKTFVSGETVTPTKLNELSQSTVALTAGTVAVADLATATVERLLPAGAVMPFAMNSAPAGWLAANGAAVDRLGTYAALFAAIGTTHGAGNGSTTFNLPDLRGIFVRGSDSQVIAGVTYTGAALGGKQGDSFRTHTHAASTNSTGAHTHSVNISVGSSGSGGGLAVASPTSNEFATARISTTSTGDHTHTVTVTATGGTETSPANIALLYCIKF